ncbi:hypothetical protein BDZ97DRAFT_1926497 [Flammula alnicola]|nr:hypothetical protein BDZ97DRAFT_1926497 [Flammula alnicola]
MSNTFGALEIGSNVAIFLFGIVTLQCYLYFSRFDDDRLAFKALVATIWSILAVSSYNPDLTLSSF